MKTLCMIVIGLAIAQTADPQITISSPAFKADGTIPARFTCKGANQNPPLQFRGIPKAAKSLVLIVDDPDAPGGLFTHWLVWNIAPVETQFRENSVPTGAVQGTNDFGQAGYGGPCPPSGTHRYYFRLLALDQGLDLKPGAKRAGLERALKGHILARGELMARFSH
ncbi:MAG: YbhB/YbcL family Raf kinase inhibitor-like protein [Chthoniobacterales bacterium]